MNYKRKQRLTVSRTIFSMKTNVNKIGGISSSNKPSYSGQFKRNRQKKTKAHNTIFCIIMNASKLLFDSLPIAK